MLTRLLKDGIGGTAKTLMIINLSPADLNIEESVRSLNFGDSLKKVKKKTPA